MERYINHPLEWPQVKTMFSLNCPLYNKEEFEDFKKVQSILFRIEDEYLRHWLRYNNMLHRPGPPAVKEKRKRLEREWGDYINGLLDKASKIQMMLVLKQQK